MIETETVERIKSLLTEHGVDEAAVGQLRGLYPQIHFTYCSEDDIHSGKPVAEEQQFSLYLVDSSEHCLCLTTDNEMATGMVIAENINE